MKPENHNAECRVQNLAWSQIVARRAVELAEFILHNDRRAFDGWPVPLLFQYSFFHLADGTAFVARDHSGICGVAFAWGMTEREIRARATANACTFNWQRSVDGADAIFLAEVIVQAKQKAESRRQTFQKQHRQMLARWPDFGRRKVFTYRKKAHQEMGAPRLLELSPRMIAMMISDQKKDAYGR